MKEIMHIISKELKKKGNSAGLPNKTHEPYSRKPVLILRDRFMIVRDRSYLNEYYGTGPIWMNTVKISILVVKTSLIGMRKIL